MLDIGRNFLFPQGCVVDPEVGWKVIQGCLFSLDVGLTWGKVKLLRPSVDLTWKSFLNHM